ncbi:MAG: serine/threonine protein kinase [Gammaproteobacteria bacterium]
MHGNLSPRCILFRDDKCPVLADLGIPVSPTNKDDFLATDHCYYANPEQAQDLSADARSDIYSAGTMFYEMLTGEKAFQGSRPNTIIFQHLHAPVPDLPEAHASFQEFLERCMAKSAEQRFAGATEAMAALGPNTSFYL